LIPNIRGVVPLQSIAGDMLQTTNNPPKRTELDEIIYT
jgi:hypothetical protein